MTTEVTIKVPGVSREGDDYDYIHQAAKILSSMTINGKVELDTSKLFQPVVEGEGGDGWDIHKMVATCTDEQYDEAKVRKAHRVLVTGPSMPSSLAVETTIDHKGTDDDLQIYG
jgi:predicted glycosyltransferase